MSTWRKVGCCLFAAVAAVVAHGGIIYHVDSLGPNDTEGSGERWDDTCSFAQAMRLATDGDEIWIKAGSYAITSALVCTNAHAIAIRGGFAGTESSADARTGGARSRFVGNDSAAIPLYFLSVPAGTVVVEDVEVERTKYGVYKNGAASVVLRNFASRACGRTLTDSFYVGRGAYLVGDSASASAVISNCVFEGNYMPGNKNGDASGCGTYLSSFNSVQIVDCLYLTNGIPLGTTSAAGRDSTRGGALRCNAQSLVCSNTRFIGNGVCCKQAGTSVYITGCANGASFDNCAFVGNWDAPWSNKDFTSPKGCTLCFDASSGTAPLSVSRCTFAYNLARAAQGGWSAGIVVAKGAATIRNCIFHGNVVYKIGTCAADVVTQASGSVDIDWCSVDATEDERANCINKDGGTLVIGPNMVYGRDPALGTDTATAMAMVSPAGLSGPLSTDTSAYVYKSGSDMLSMDVRLKSTAGSWNGTSWVEDETSSPLIDAGDPSSDWRAEPEPNGGQINLGYLGNTPYASKTAPAKPGIASADLDTVSDYSQPHVAVKMGGSGEYAAAVFFCWGTSASVGEGTNGWQHVVKSADAVQMGDEVDARPMEYLTPSSEISWRVVVMRGDTVDAAVDGTATCGSELPPWYGKGGGADIVHVRPGATGKGDGTNWTDAYGSIADGLSALSAARPTAWVAGTWELAKNAATVTVDVPARVIGGFAGVENAPEQRAAGARTTVDGMKNFDTFSLTNAAAVTMEDFVFTRAYKNAFEKTGDGDLTLRNCAFTFNGYDSLRAQLGRGFRVTKSAGAHVNFIGCTFDSNRFRGDDTSAGFAFGCSSAYFKDVGRVFFDACLFVSNGFDRAASTPGREGSYGGILYAENAPVTAVNTRFVNNRQTSHGGAGGLMLLKNFSAACAFTNCLWIANQHMGYLGSSSGHTDSGVVHMTGADTATPIEFVNCTMAFNPCDFTANAALTLVKGACRIRNSIFFCNLCNSAETVAADIKVGASATLDIDYSLLADSTARYISQNASASQGAGMVYGDPVFMTSADDFLGALNNPVGTLPKVTMSRPFPKTSDDALISAINCHLVGSRYVDELTGLTVSTRGQRVSRGISPGLAAGDRATPCDREPQPNGGRVNLGFYGNTPWATTKLGGMALIVR